MRSQNPETATLAAFAEAIAISTYISKTTEAGVL
jgi:hypothetical protein